MTTRIIAVLNQKGGVGKTTTCVNLGAALASRGKQVLLIDMDPQANLTVHLGMEPQSAPRSSYSLLLGEHGITDAMIGTETPNLRVVPSTLGLANAEVQLASAVGRELILREALENWLNPLPEMSGLSSDDEARETVPPADFVLIDCPPSLGILTMNALCAATEVLLPIQTEFFALQGVAGILESLRAVQRLNKGLRLSMVLPCMADFRTNLARDVIQEVRKYFGSLVTRTTIRTNVKLAEAPSHGKSILEYAPNSRGAQDYSELASEVLGEIAAPDEEPITAEHPGGSESEPEPEQPGEAAEEPTEAIDFAPIDAGPAPADPPPAGISLPPGQTAPALAEALPPPLPPVDRMTGRALAPEEIEARETTGAEPGSRGIPTPSGGLSDHA